MPVHNGANHVRGLAKVHRSMHAGGRAHGPDRDGVMLPYPIAQRTVVGETWGRDFALARSVKELGQRA